MGYKLQDVADSLSFPAFAERGLKIITMQGELKPLVLNLPQLKVHSILAKQQEAGLPMRAIVLKARREGVSTYVEARYFREINRRPMRYACVCSADIDSTDKVFKMASLFQDEIPADLKRPTDYSNRKEIVYSAPHRSQFLCQTAGKDVLGRGGLTHYLHATEFAFWQRAKEQLGGAAQEIPDDPETAIIIESTANGTGGAFYDDFILAVDHWRTTKSLDGYMPIFLPWHIFAAYRRQAPRGWQSTPEERELQKEYNLDNDQLYWRQWAIENKCQGDLALFKQEYPITWQEAFQATGAPVFSPGIFRFQERHIRDDYKWGLFDPRTGDFMPHESRWGWCVLDLEAGSREYAIGADTAEHRLLDDRDPHSKRDNDGIAILDRSTKRAVAIWCERGGAQNELGAQILGAGRHYNQAWVNIEIPKGLIALQVLVDAGYQNIYRKRSRETQGLPVETEELGYRVTPVTRQWLINDLISALRADSIILQFRIFLDQMQTFQYDKTGKPIHMPGKHDDLIFGLGHALQADLHCPKETAYSLPERTGDNEPRHQRTINDLAYAGAVDNFDEDEVDYDDSYWRTS